LALISCDSDPSVSRRRRLGLRLEPAYCAPIHVVGRGDVRAAIAFRQTRASALLSLRHHSMVDRRRHAAGNALPLHQGVWSVHEARVPSTSSSVGNRPVAFFEKANLPFTVISKTPPPDLRSWISAEGIVVSIISRTLRARGSYPHIPQYSISTCICPSFLWARTRWQPTADSTR